MKALTMNMLFTTLFILIIFDFILGIMVACKNRNLASRTCSDGLFRKMGECALLLLISIINGVFPHQNILHFYLAFLIFALIIKEMISIGENLHLLNVWIPQFIKKSLSVCVDKIDSIDVNELKELIKDVKELKEKKEDNK
jgi:toxin secretion/phage lysis holin